MLVTYAILNIVFEAASYSPTAKTIATTTPYEYYTTTPSTPASSSVTVPFTAFEVLVIILLVQLLDKFRSKKRRKGDHTSTNDSKKLTFVIFVWAGFLLRFKKTLDHPKFTNLAVILELCEDVSNLLLFGKCFGKTTIFRPQDLRSTLSHTSDRLHCSRKPNRLHQRRINHPQKSQASPRLKALHRRGHPLTKPLPHLPEGRPPPLEQPLPEDPSRQRLQSL